jgi:hypothetical protein
MNGLIAELPAGSDKECVPVAAKGSLPETTDAPPLSDQPCAPVSNEPPGISV